MANFGEVTVHVKVESFIPQYYYQALARRAAEDMARKGYVMINDLGDAVTLEEFERLVEEASQYEITEEEWRKMYQEQCRALALRMGIPPQLQADWVNELDQPWTQEYLKPHDYLGDRIDMPVLPEKNNGLPVQSIDSVTASTSHLGYPMYQPNPPAMPATPTKAPEPEFGVVVIGGTEVPPSTVNALLSGKFIQEGENIDTSFRQYLVLFRNDDWHRNEAVNLRQQLRDLIRGVEVVLIPVNGG